MPVNKISKEDKKKVEDVHKKLRNQSISSDKISTCSTNDVNGKLIPIINEYNLNKNALCELFDNIPDFNKDEKDRDLYFLGLIKKQLKLKNVPSGDLVQAFDLILKRANKLYAVVSTYVTGKKHKDFKSEKWGGDANVKKGTFVNLKKYYKKLSEYLEQLMLLLKNREFKNAVKRNYEASIGGTAVDGATFNKKVAIGELDTVLSLRNGAGSDLGPRFAVAGVVEALSTLDGGERSEKYDKLKKLFFRIRKHYKGNPDVDVATLAAMLNLDKITNMEGVNKLLQNENTIISELKKKKKN